MLLFSNSQQRQMVGTGKLPFVGGPDSPTIFPPYAKAFRDPPLCWVQDKVRAGVIANARSHRNRRNGLHFDVNDNVFYAVPQSREALRQVLAEYAAEGVNLLIVDGGDGTIRDVLTTAPEVFPVMPPLAVIPSGKTNSVAIDLGIPATWTIRDAVAAARAGRFVSRRPVEVSRKDGSARPLRGFLLGAGGFVRATELGQRTHRMGAFRSVAVAWSLCWSIAQTSFGGRGNPWRQGERMRFRMSDGHEVADSFYVLLVSTLQRLPLGLKPFGPERAGMKALAVKAPPAHPLLLFVPLIAGATGKWLARFGYHRAYPDAFEVALDGKFIMDGEQFPGGDLKVRAGEPILFAAP